MQRIEKANAALGFIMLAFVLAMILFLFAPKTHAQPRINRCPCDFTLPDTTHIRVLHIVDGDTFKVPTQVIDSVLSLVVDSTSHEPRHVWATAYRDTLVSIRIVGLDTYETKQTPKMAKQAAKSQLSGTEVINLGNLAKDHATKLILKKDVILCRDFQTPRLDHFCRPLYRVWFDYIDNLVEYATEFINAGLADMNSEWTQKPKTKK